MLMVDATSLGRFIACNGSRLMGGNLPPMTDDNTARDEGIAAHYVAAATFNNVHSLAELIDRKAPNGVFITPDMTENVEKYLSAIRQFPSDFSVMEHVTTFNGKGWQVNARADHVAWHAASRTLYINDFKYGWRLVEPEMNWTLIAHAIGYCIANKITPTLIVLTICQPRPHHADGQVRSWSITYDDLLQYFAQIDAALSAPNDELRTGTHCAKCPALAVCPAARKAGLNAIDVSEMAFDETISDAMLARELDLLAYASAALKNRQRACEELAAHRIRNGSVVDNYSLMNGLSNRQWKKGITAELIRAISGIDVSKPEIVSPKEAERRGVNTVVVAKLAERIPTGAKLIRANVDKRAARMFDKQS